MKILLMNMNMFNNHIDNSFSIYLKEINPHIAVIQECRYNKLRELIGDYHIIWPSGYSEKNADSRIHFTLVLSKSCGCSKKYNDTLKIYNYRLLKIEYENIALTAVHIPFKEKDKEENYKNLLSAIINSKSKIICGDFNASSKGKGDNYDFLKKLITEKGYVNLWDEGIKSNKAFYLNYKGEEREAKKDKFYRTYVGNTHIDYVLGMNNSIILKKIVIDTRTLAFTDHCGIIAEIEPKCSF